MTTNASNPAPVVLTGASGFLAKHVARALLGAGHQVRGSLRDPARAGPTRAAILDGLPPEAGERLSFAALDLTRDEGWPEALAGAKALVHTASPFPLQQPRDAQELIRPAVEGTRRALRSAFGAGVGRVVLTSSTVAARKPGGAGDETDWTDPDAPGLAPYEASKTLAERAAWDLAREMGRDGDLAVVNPGLILGPLLDDQIGTSAGLVQRLLKGRDPALPDLRFHAVDARDVAEAHLRALHVPEAGGERILAVAGPLSFPRMAALLKAAYPSRRIPTRVAPKPVVRLLSLFIPELRPRIRELGRDEPLSNAKARRLLGMTFIPAEDALRATAESLIARGLA